MTAEKSAKHKVPPNFDYENELRAKYQFIAGIDEAGRGPLAGPVVATALILPIDFPIDSGINDSKKLSARKRDELFDLINQSALCIGIGIVEPKLIDKINILQATYLAMKIAVENLNQKPDFLLVDGNSFKPFGIEFKTIVKGDSKSISIAAASIIAKVTRDRIMEEYDSVYPEYSLKQHKGYGTKKHIEAIEKYGILPIHRKSFLKRFSEYTLF